MKVKIKPPTETKAELMREIAMRLAKLNAYPQSIDYLLNFFTSVDLAGIRDDLRRMNNGL